MYKNSENEAWDVPNSNMVVNLATEHESKWTSTRGIETKTYYSAGVAVKQGKNGGVSFVLFKEKGETKFNAFENLLAKIDKAAELIFKMIDICEKVNPNDVPVINLQGWEHIPPKDDDFFVSCFSSLSRTLFLMEKSKSDVDVSICRKDYNGNVFYYGQVKVGNEIVYKAKPAFEKKDVIKNIMYGYIGAGAMLEKFQDMSWNVMVDSHHPDYKVDNQYGERNMMLRKMEKN